MSRGYIGNYPDATPFDLSPFYAALRGAISGVIQSQAADTDHDITLSVGGALDDTHSDWLALDTAITKQIDAAWAAGTNQGGLDTGTVGNSTWYYIWLIKNPTTDVVDALFSTSASSPTMPSGYTLKRLVGAVLTDGSANIVAFTAEEISGGGLAFHWSTPTLDVNLANTLTTSRRLDTLRVPTSFRVWATIHVVTTDATTSQATWIGNPDHADAAVSTTSAPLATTGSATDSTVYSLRSMRVRTSSSGQIAARSNLATVDTYGVSTQSWEWSRR